MALIVAGAALFGYLTTRSTNPITGEAQNVAMTVDQEIAMGLQAAPDMADQFGGMDSDRAGQARVDAIGARLLSGYNGLDRSPYVFEFHLLADPQTLNAFALPGGQIFITAGLYRRLETDGQLAGVLAHEIGHVIERHGAQHLAKEQLTQGLTGAAVIATYDPNDPASRNTAQVAALLGTLVNMRYGRNDELESDRWGVRLCHAAGYDPRAMIRVMEILAEAAGPDRPPEFFSTHPNPEHRIERIEQAIGEEFPDGIPSLEP
ncbi:MAG: M48 family metallopeptidase [Candidatus Eisenbacteria bacterium]|uniref:M48 family metallopeptidase n=1 Tax=Eiseniibacteriota bacterium TaxID=2212470 RepID=A0A956M052_UNCEI|nr:M48 family metallopeptidase [Candidatus Eisenbacteria bacterium]